MHSMTCMLNLTLLIRLSLPVVDGVPVADVPGQPLDNFGVRGGEVLFFMGIQGQIE
jgi:hypothetical protein